MSQPNNKRSLHVYSDGAYYTESAHQITDVQNVVLPLGATDLVVFDEGKFSPSRQIDTGDLSIGAMVHVNGKFHGKLKSIIGDYVIITQNERVKRIKAETIESVSTGPRFAVGKELNAKWVNLRATMDEIKGKFNYYMTLNGTVAKSISLVARITNRLARAFEVDSVNLTVGALETRRYSRTNWKNEPWNEAKIECRIEQPESGYHELSARAMCAAPMSRQESEEDQAQTFSSDAKAFIGLSTDVLVWEKPDANLQRGYVLNLGDENAKVMWGYAFNPTAETPIHQGTVTVCNADGSVVKIFDTAAIKNGRVTWMVDEASDIVAVCDFRAQKGSRKPDEQVQQFDKFHYEITLTSTKKDTVLVAIETKFLGSNVVWHGATPEVHADKHRWIVSVSPETPTVFTGGFDVPI